jgi:hypothetical protein
VDWLGQSWRLLDPALFWRKMAMLVVFFGLFVPIYLFRTTLAVWYAVFLLALHVYVLGVYLWRVRWRILIRRGSPFLARLFTIAVFVTLLMVIRAGATIGELTMFVALSGLVHVGILLALNLDVRPAAHRPSVTDS